MHIDDLEISKITFPYDGPASPYDEIYPPDPDYGHLYVIEFSSGWIKVGKTSDWPKRLRTHRYEYGKAYGWSVTNQWNSCVVSDFQQNPPYSSDLSNIEQRLIRYARLTSDGRELNPWVRGVGRDRTRRPETELFCGCNFGTVCAYADVLALCDAHLM